MIHMHMTVREVLVFIVPHLRTGDTGEMIRMWMKDEIRDGLKL